MEPRTAGGMGAAGSARAASGVHIFGRGRGEGGARPVRGTARGLRLAAKQQEPPPRMCWRNRPQGKSTISAVLVGAEAAGLDAGYGVAGAAGAVDVAAFHFLKYK